jgi:hypothetical protein
MRIDDCRLFRLRIDDWDCGLLIGAKSPIDNLNPQIRNGDNPQSSIGSLQ